MVVKPFSLALASEQPKRLYGRLGFRPLTQARAWVRKRSEVMHQGMR